VIQLLARLIVKKSVAFATVLAVVCVAVLSLLGAARIQQDDDLLAFLPKDDPDVRTFYEVNRRFGGLAVALVGIRADDAFDPDFLTRLRKATRKLNETEGIDYALSLANFEDFTADTEKGGIGIDYLIPDAPADPAALRDKVLSREQAVNNVISADGKAVLLYGFLSYGAEPKATAARVRSIVEEAFPREAKYWGGNPFVSGYIYDVSQSDIRQLAPWAALVILVITLLALRDAIATCLALLGAALAILISLGLMGALGVHANVMIGSLPVVVFALGSASVIPILTRYQALAAEVDSETAIRQTLTEIGPTVAATGLTAALSLLSLGFMDIAPMRAFGVFTAVGLFASLILALTFVPAVLRIVGLKGRPAGKGALRAFLVQLCRGAAAQRRTIAVGIGIVVAAGAFLVTRLESRMDNAAFFSKGSPPALANDFLRDHFGGSQFFQIQVEGDMTDPAVLREVRAIADKVALLPHVTSVNHVANVVAKINEAMEGDERIPDTGAKVKLLYGFLAGKRAVSQLATEDQRFALLQITVDAEGKEALEALLKQVEDLAAAQGLERYVVADPASAGPAQAAARARREALVRARVLSIAKRASIPLDPAKLSFEAAPDRGPAEAKPTEAAILAFLRSEEFIGELPATPADAPAKVAAALGALGPGATKQALAEALGKALDRAPDDAAVADLVAAIDKPVREILKRQQALARAARLIDALSLAIPEGAPRTRFSTSFANALMDLEAPSVLLPATAGQAPEGAMKLRVTGLPVMNRGLARSVAENQQKSIAIALGLVLVIMSALYRSIPSGLLAMSPVVLTMLIIYGLMSALGLSLDIGTSMLASLITGAGVTYAVHLLDEWSAPPEGTLADAAASAGGRAGPAIWTNAIMVAAGFLVLTQGQARPLQSVGGLTAAAMITAALATFVAIPALARKRRYRALTQTHPH
jgi:predicted RND superfamily exporter protein